MRFKKVVIFSLIMLAYLFPIWEIDAANAQGNFPIDSGNGVGSCERWMGCGWEKAWLGDSLAHVQRKCGMPSQVLYGPSLMITEHSGPVSVTRFVRTIIYLYPGYGGNGTMYFLRFKDLQLVSICQERW